jgi:hypothetical protein
VKEKVYLPIFTILFGFSCWLVTGIILYSFIFKEDVWRGEAGNLLFNIIYYQSLVGTVFLYPIIKEMARDLWDWIDKLVKRWQS